MQRPQFQTGTLSTVEGIAQLQNLLAQQQGAGASGPFQVTGMMGSAGDPMAQPRFTLAAPVQMLPSYVMPSPSSMPANTTNSLQSADGLQLYGAHPMAGHPGQLDMASLGMLQAAMAQQQACQQPLQQLPAAGRPINIAGVTLDANSAEAALQLLATRGQAGISAVVNAAMPQRSGDSRASGSAYASRHQAAEQRRRLRINERLDALRKLVPHAERANTACFLEEVIKYIGHMKERCDQLEGALSGVLNSIGPLPTASTSGGGANAPDAAGAGQPSREAILHAAQILGMPPQYPPPAARPATTSTTSPTNLLLQLQRQVNPYSQLQAQHLQGANLAGALDGAGLAQTDSMPAPPPTFAATSVDVSALLQNNKSPGPMLVDTGEARPGSVFKGVTPTIPTFHATSAAAPPPPSNAPMHQLIAPQPVHAAVQPPGSSQPQQQPGAPSPMVVKQQEEPHGDTGPQQQPSSSSSAPLEAGPDQTMAQSGVQPAGEVVVVQAAADDAQPAQSAHAPATATATTTAATPPPPTVTPTPSPAIPLALPGLTAEQLQILLAQALEMQQQTARAAQQQQSVQQQQQVPTPVTSAQQGTAGLASAGDRPDTSSPHSSEDSGMPFKKRKHVQQP